MGLTRIPVSAEVRDRLKRLAAKDETYDAVLRRLLADAEMRLLHERERRILLADEFAPRSRT